MSYPTEPISRRAAVQRVAAMMGGLALVGGDRAWAFSADEAARAQAAANGAGMFTAADIALLDEIAETIVPETTTPGAKAARTGAFMALMVEEVYTDRNQQVFRDGLRALEASCRRATGVGFMDATSPQRLGVLEVLDREQRTAAQARVTIRTRFPPAETPDEDEPVHYFRMMKELALLGYFTSEIGYTKAMRYRETPGRYDPDVPYAEGDTSWAPHA